MRGGKNEVNNLCIMEDRKKKKFLIQGKHFFERTRTGFRGEKKCFCLKRKEKEEKKVCAIGKKGSTGHRGMFATL